MRRVSPPENLATRLCFTACGERFALTVSPVPLRTLEPWRMTFLPAVQPTRYPSAPANTGPVAGSSLSEPLSLTEVALLCCFYPWRVHPKLQRHPAPRRLHPRERRPKDLRWPTVPTPPLTPTTPPMRTSHFPHRCFAQAFGRLTVWHDSMGKSSSGRQWRRCSRMA